MSYTGEHSTNILCLQAKDLSLPGEESVQWEGWLVSTQRLCHPVSGKENMEGESKCLPELHGAVWSIFCFCFSRSSITVVLFTQKTRVITNRAKNRVIKEWFS